MQAPVGCGNCGRDNPPEARFCVYCGAELGMRAEETPASGAEERPPSPALDNSALTAPADKAGTWQRIVLVVTALLLVGFGWLGFYVGGEFYEFREWRQPSLLAGLVFGAIFAVAAVRPPSGTLRRLLVALGLLVILVAVVALIGVGMLILWFIYFY